MGARREHRRAQHRASVMLAGAVLVAGNLTNAVDHAAVARAWSPSPHVSYEQSVLADSPQLYYHLDESGGSTVTDASGHGNNGTYNTVTYGIAGPLVGDAATAVENSNGTTAALSTSAVLPTGSAPRTAEEWLRTSKGSQYVHFLTYGNPQVAHGGFDAYIAPDNTFDLSVDGSTTWTFGLPHGYNDSSWHLYALAYDGQTVTAYADGQLLGSTSVGSLATTTGGTVTVDAAGYSTGANDFAQLAVYPSALSATRLDAHWTSGASSSVACVATPTSPYAGAVLADAPAAYYRLGDLTANPSGSVAYDSSSHCLNAAYKVQDVAAQPSGALVGDADGAMTTTNVGPAVTQTGATVPTGSSPRTVEGWVRTNQGSEYIHLATDGSSNGTKTQFDVYLDQGNYLRVGLDATTNIAFPLPHYQVDGLWHQVDVTYDGATIVAYIDGQGLGSAQVGALATSTGTPLSIGTSGYVVGHNDIDEVSIYPTALAAARIAAHWTVAGAVSTLCQTTSASTSAESAAVIDAHPLAYYRFSDLGTTPVPRVAADSSGHCRNGAYYPPQIQFQPSGASPSDAGGALNYSYGYLGLGLTGSSEGLPLGHSPRTVVGWVRTTGGNEVALIAGYGSQGVAGGGFQISLLNNYAPCMQVVIDQNTSIQTCLPTPYWDGNWHQYAVTYDGTTLVMYQDGGAVKTQAVALNTVDGSPLSMAGVIGGATKSTDFDELAVFPTALSGSQIANLYTAAQPPPPVGGVPSAAEGRAGNFCYPCMAHGGRPRMADPVETLTGNLTETAVDFAIAGRGDGLDLNRTYNSDNAAANGVLGYGWSPSFGASLSVDPSTQAVTITQENGGQTVFTLSNGIYSAPPRIIATLVKNANGTFTFVRGRRDTLVFSATGQLTAMTDLHGNTTSLGYNGSGQLASVTDASGRSLTFAYTAGLLTAVTDGTGRKVTYAYNDGNGNLTDVVDVDGNSTQYVYDTAHRLLTMRDPLGHTVTNHYDSSGRVDWQTHQQSATSTPKTTFAYAGTPFGAAGGTTTITDPVGNVTVQQFVYGERVATTSGYGTPAQATTVSLYDPSTLALATAIDPTGNASTFTYDTSGNLLAATDPLGRQTVNTWDGLRDELTTTDPKGVTTTMSYDASGTLLQTSTPCPDCTPAATKVVVYHHADPTHPEDVTSTTDADGKTWQYGYDAYGNRTSQTDPVGNTATWTFNTLDWPLTAVSPRGNVAGCGCQAQFTTTYSYTLVGTSTVDEYGDVQSVTDPLGHVTKVTYDNDRNPVTSTDANGNLTTTTYDLANEATSVTRADHTTTRTDFNPDGTVQDQVDAHGATTSYFYDALDRVVRTTDPLNRATTMTYDAAGNRLSITDPQGQVTTDTYDAAHELLSIGYSDGVTPNVSSLTYDADGQRTTMTDGTGTSTQTWDSLHRMTSSTDGAAVPGGGGKVTYGYDLKGQMTGLTYVNGLVVTRTYDDAGRLTAVRDSTTGKTTTYSPDADSDITSIQYANGTAAAMSFDHTDTLTGITDTLNGSSASFGYGRDAMNQESSVSASGVPSDSHSYGYTPLNQLGSVDGSSYQYDSADNLTGLTGGIQQRNDAANELTSRVQLVGAASQAPSLGSSATVTLPGGIQPQDVLLIATTQVSTSTATTPAGYTAGPSVTSTGTPATTTQLFYKRAGGGEANPTLSYSSLARPAIVVAVYRGIDPATFDAALHTGSTTSGTQVGVAGFATTAIGDELVMIGGASGNATAQTWTAPSGMATRAQTASQTLASSGLFDETLGAPGTVGTQTATVSGSAEPLTGILVALKPLAPLYDARGNRLTTPIGGGAQATLTYDQANRLTGYGGSVTYTYNGDGLRMEKTISGSAQHLTWNVAEGLPLLLDDGTSSYVYGPGGSVLEQIADQPATPITLVGTAGFSRAATSSVQVALPPGIRSNDQIIASVTEDGTQTVTASGYTVVGSATTTNTVQPSETALLRRTATGGETTATFTLGSVVPEAAVTIAIYRGVDPANPTGPLDGPATATTGGGTGTSLGVGPVTATYPGATLVVAQGAGNFVTASSWTAPSGMHEEYTQQGQGLAAGALADQALTSAGSTGTRVASFGTAAELSAVMVALRPAQPVLYYHGDQLQSTRVLTDSAGVVRAAFTFDPYGNLVGQSGTATTPLLFNGQYRDAESGFYYLRARFYDPSTGQFLSRDPAVAVTRSPYAYVAGNPLNATDPSGLYVHAACIDADCGLTVNQDWQISTENYYDAPSATRNCDGTWNFLSADQAPNTGQTYWQEQAQLRANDETRAVVANVVAQLQNGTLVVGKQVGGGLTIIAGSVFTAAKVGELLEAVAAADPAVLAPLVLLTGGGGVAFGVLIVGGGIYIATH